MPKTRAGFKKYERRLAALAGWRRTPVTGRQGPGGDPGDAESGPFYTEIRSRNEPRPVRWFAETAKEAAAAGKIPLLLFRGPSSTLSPLAIMLWTDLAEVIELAKRAANAGPTADGPGPDPGPGPDTPHE